MNKQEEKSLIEKVSSITQRLIKIEENNIGLNNKLDAMNSFYANTITKLNSEANKAEKTKHDNNKTIPTTKTGDRK